jgi:hypothetical protein
MKRPWVRVLVTAGLFFGVPALASVVVAQTIEEMTRAAPLVVRARVGQVQVSWDEGQKKIWTRAELQILETVKGAPASTVLVRQPGGELATIAQRVDGAAQFKTGEEGIFFLETVPDEPNVFTVYALGAGKVLFETSKTGEVRAVRNLDGLAFYALPSKQVVKPVSDREDLGTPQTLITRLKKAAGGAR